MIQQALLAVRNLLPATAFLLASAASSFAAGNVLVVDGTGAGSYTTIQAAVDAAVDGDVVLVRTGSYAGFVIADKTLTVLGDVNAQVNVVGGARVRDLAATRTVALLDLDFQGGNNTTVGLSNGLLLDNDAGHVRVERCLVVGGGGSTGSGLHVIACADVALGACELRGGARPDHCASGGGPGLSALAFSTIALYGCLSTGGNGAHGGCDCDGGAGGHGALVQQSTLFTSKSTFRGGTGGNAADSSLFTAAFAGDGGDGIAASASSTVRILDSVTTGGIPGSNSLPACGQYGGNGSPGLARRGTGFSDLAGTARSLSAHAIVHAGTIESFTVRGNPGDQVGLFVSPTTTAQFVPSWNGVLLVPLRTPPQATRLLHLGVMPAGGSLEFSLPIPALAPGESSRTSFIQALLLDTQGQHYLSSARTLVTLP